MLDDPDLTVATLTDLLAFSRTRPSLDELLVFFTARASTVVSADEIEVHHGETVATTPVAADGTRAAHVSRHPVLCGHTPWGELRLIYHGAVPALIEPSWGRLLAEVLGAALVTAGLETAKRKSDLPVADVRRPDPDDLVALVLHCAEALDLMADASTRERLAVIADRLAGAVGARSWSVWLRHGRKLYDMASDGATDEPFAGSATATGALVLDEFPARLRASAGGGFYADRSTGDRAERRALGGADVAITGAGGYDPDGRSWVVTLRSGSASGLEDVTPVLFALVLSALSFPREAAVPRPEEPWVHRVLTGAGRGHPGEDGAEVDEAG